MSRTTFKTNPVGLEDLLKECHSGKLQLPDFQRSWVWAEDRIESLIASVSRAFPIGALMTLASKPGREEIFASRAIEGAPAAAKQAAPEHLLLDGQQRMTSLYQACMRREVVTTITPKNKLGKRWFYIDIRKALDSDIDRDEAIVAVPEDRRIKTNFDRTILRDLSKPEFEYEHFMFPLNQVFDWDAWQEGFGDYWIAKGQAEQREVFKSFKNDVLQSFKSYQVPVIALDHNTSHEAVCLVFEKVNTGGKALDAFELLTAMYAARGHRLRDDWLGTDGQSGMQERLATYGHAGSRRYGVLEKVASTEVLQAIALLHTKEVRLRRAAEGAKDNELPAVRATRQSLLDLPLKAYMTYREPVEAAYKLAAKFLRQQYIHGPWDLPYQTQLVPLAAIFADLGDAAEHAGSLEKISRWYWCGIFGELYGSAAESRFAKDVVEVPAWIRGGAEPTTVRDGVFRADRLDTMRTRLSAAYKGVNALLMREGSRDFRTGQKFEMTVFFDEDVDIHHIFPKTWCENEKIPAKVYDTVINKTPLGYRTNRIIGGAAPSKYIERLQDGKTDGKGQVVEPPIARETLDAYLGTHGIEPAHLRSDDFKAFMQSRRAALLALISKVTGHATSDVAETADDGVELTADMARDSDLYLEEQIGD